jgi:hypothetical protein
MSDASPTDVQAYVRVTARELGLSLSPEQEERVAAVFARNAELGERVMAVPLEDDAPPGAVFRP